MQKLPIYGIKEFVEDKGEKAFYSNNMRTHLETHHFINNPHKHNTFITIFCTKGTGVHQIDFDTFPVKPGCIFMMNPGQIHCWKLSDDIDGWVFFHTKEFFNEIFIHRKIEDFPFFYLQKKYPVVYLQEEDIQKFENLFKEINSEYYANLPYKNERIASLVDLIYISISRHYQFHSEEYIERNAHYLLVKKLQKLIDENYKTIKSPSDYAEMMNMSTRHLSRISQEVLNKSTSDLIVERIILEIKRMLILKIFTVSEIADELGYDDYSYFARLFKSKTGLTPKQFQVHTQPFS